MDIKKAKYVGYLWFSNQQEPEVFYGDKEFEISIPNDQNPFIIEGYLWNEELKESISIKYVDGAYLLKNENCKNWLENENDNKRTFVSFIPHRIKKIKKLNFIQCWDEKKDSLCDNMKVLTPTKLVFCGFTK